jgi:hypothetical protein
LLHPEISISNTVDLPYIASTSATRTSTYTKAEIDTQLNNDQGHDGTDDIRILTQAESDYVTELINVVSQTDTPMQTYLDENLSDKIK